jgi:hypothetical protein
MGVGVGTEPGDVVCVGTVVCGAGGVCGATALSTPFTWTPLSTGDGDRIGSVALACAVSVPVPGVTGDVSRGFGAGPVTAVAVGSIFYLGRSLVEQTQV